MEFGGLSHYPTGVKPEIARLDILPVANNRLHHEVRAPPQVRRDDGTPYLNRDEFQVVYSIDFLLIAQRHLPAGNAHVAVFIYEILVSNLAQKVEAYTFLRLLRRE